MKLTGYTLKIGFASKADAKEFLCFLAYLQHCGDVGHSAGITVNADGDGSFKCSVEIDDGNGFRNLRDAMEVPPGHWDRAVAEYRRQKEARRSEGIPDSRIDRNEIAFSLGD